MSDLTDRLDAWNAYLDGNGSKETILSEASQRIRELEAAMRRVCETYDHALPGMQTKTAELDRVTPFVVALQDLRALVENSRDE